MTQEKAGVRLSHFKIRSSSGTACSSKVYANGRHQCEVIIEVDKEAQDPSGAWRSVELSDQERDSITLTEYSSDRNQILGLGWSCDKKRNGYDLGLREGIAVGEPVSYDVSPQREYVRRYIRCAPAMVDKSVIFMARIIFDEQVYTTYCSNGEMDFNSMVTVESVRPYTLKVADLTLYHDEMAFLAGGSHVQCYYWTPPDSLRFVLNAGVQGAVDLMDMEGGFFQTSYVHKNPSHGVGFKGGVVVGVDYSSHSLRLDDVHHGYYYPWNNPSVRFHERPTIMRAFHVRDEMPEINEAPRSPWLLFDNFGNSHAFLLVPVPGVDPGLRLEDYEDEELGDTNIKNFKIIFPDGQPFSTALYANGRHQCKVLIEATKEEYQEDGTWKVVPLTQTERDSATVTLYSANDGQALPSGWSCDKSVGIYDLGLWRTVEGGSDQQALVNLNYTGGVSAEVIDRYMRVAAGRPIESMRFMARIIVGGKVYTTFHSNGGEHVTITPTQPYTIKAADLTAQPDLAAYDDYACDCDVYYWMLPSGLRFLVNRGLATPFRINNEGDYFTTAWSKYNRGVKNYCKAGVLVTKDNPALRIRMKDVHRGVYGGSDGLNPYIPFNKHNTMMRAVRLMAKETTFTTGDASTPWRLWDNYGCEHVYRLDFGREGLDIILKDY